MTQAPGTPAAAGAARSPAARVLRRPNFQRLWTGSVASALGAAIGSIVITWLVYSSTHSPLAISLLGIVQFLPTLLFGLLSGALVDRLDRRRLMVACDIARAVAFGGLAVYVLLFGASVPVILVVVFVVAAFGTIFRPATNATIPRILTPDEVTDGNGILQGASTIASFVGSPIGGLLVVASGAFLGLALNALTFALSAAMIFLMVVPPAVRSEARPPGERSLLHEVREGLTFLRSQRALLVITVTAMIANFFLSIWGGFTVIYAADRLQQGAAGFGVLVAATTAGFAIGSILPGRLHTDRKPGVWLIASWGLTGAFILGIALTRSLALAAALELVTGLLISIGNTTWLSGVQRTVPNQFLGRYLATDEAGSFAMIPAALAVGGVLILYIGVAGAFAVAGIGTLVTNSILVLSPSVKEWGRRGPDVPGASGSGHGG